LRRVLVLVRSRPTSLTPTATSETHSALNTLPWFVEGTEVTRDFRADLKLVKFRMVFKGDN
jgi:hypothetical protein